MILLYSQACKLFLKFSVDYLPLCVLYSTMMLSKMLRWRKANPVTSESKALFCYLTEKYIHTLTKTKVTFW